MATHRVDIDRLVRELEALTPEERAQVISAISAKRERTKPARAVTPKRFRELVGIMNVGGDAIEDTERFYDDA